jgi:hypothetical protein
VRDVRVYFQDILVSIATIERYTAGMDWDAFAANGQAQDSEIRRLEIIGEAVKGIPEEKVVEEDLPLLRSRIAALWVAGLVRTVQPVARRRSRRDVEHPGQRDRPREAGALGRRRAGRQAQEGGPGVLQGG